MKLRHVTAIASVAVALLILVLGGRGPGLISGSAPTSAQASGPSRTAGGSLELAHSAAIAQVDRSRSIDAGGMMSGQAAFTGQFAPDALTVVERSYLPPGTHRVESTVTGSTFDGEPGDGGGMWLYVFQAPGDEGMMIELEVVFADISGNVLSSAMRLLEDDLRAAPIILTD